MASLGHIDYSVLKGTTQDDVNASTAKEIAALTKQVKELTAKAVTADNINVAFRSSPPKAHSKIEVIHYDNLELGDHRIWADPDVTNGCPPVPYSQWVNVEVIFVHDTGLLQPNVMQRAWGDFGSFLAARSRNMNSWTPWTILSATAVVASEV